MAEVSERISKHVHYKRWDGIVQRCYNPADVNYANYGGRGIRMGGEWDRRNKEGAANFIAWLEAELLKLPDTERSKPFIVARKEVEDNYTPDNCHVTTNREACQNRRSTVLTFQRVVEMRKYKKAHFNTSMKDMCFIFNIDHVYTLSRCLLGLTWSNVDAVEPPLVSLYRDGKNKQQVRQSGD